jgi:hypothetical protein
VPEWCVRYTHGGGEHAAGPGWCIDRQIILALLVIAVKFNHLSKYFNTFIVVWSELTESEFKLIASIITPC